MNPWTVDKIEMLRRLVADGFSASQIAKEIGGVSRNAVIGKATRLKLELKGATTPTPSQKSPARKAKAPPRMARMPKPRSGPEEAARADLKEFLDRAPPAVVDSVSMPKSLGLSLMELGAGDCRWPEGEREHITFCGHNVEAGRSYCPYHVRLSRGKGTESERRAGRELMRAA